MSEGRLRTYIKYVTLYPHEHTQASAEALDAFQEQITTGGWEVVDSFWYVDKFDNRLHHEIQLQKQVWKNET